MELPVYVSSEEVSSLLRWDKNILLKNNKVIDWCFFCFYKWKLWNFNLSFVVTYLPKISIRIFCWHINGIPTELKQSKSTFHVLTSSSTMSFRTEGTQLSAKNNCWTFSCNIQKNSTMTFNCSLLLRYELPESSNKVSRPSNLGNMTFYSYGVRFYALSIMCLRVSEFQLLQLHKSVFEQRTKATGQVRVNPCGNTPNKPYILNFFIRLLSFVGIGLNIIREWTQLSHRFLRF